MKSEYVDKLRIIPATTWTLNM